MPVLREPVTELFAVSRLHPNQPARGQVQALPLIRSETNMRKQAYIVRP